jgi:hypothetical protein
MSTFTQPKVRKNRMNRVSPCFPEEARFLPGRYLFPVYCEDRVEVTADLSPRNVEVAGDFPLRPTAQL